MFTSATGFRAFNVLKCSKYTFLRTTTTYMAAPPTTTVCPGALSIDPSPNTSPSSGDPRSYINEARPATVTLQEWQAWGTDSPFPTQVAEIVEEMILSESESDAQMKFGGLGGKLKVSGTQTLFPFPGFLHKLSIQSTLNDGCFFFFFQMSYPIHYYVISKISMEGPELDHICRYATCKLWGDFKTQEDKKHRAKYRALDDSEQKLHFFSARQIACRLLGSRGYLCQKCWLPLEDCMCLRVVPCSLWNRMRFWLYMHPKDFLRQNNTGKLLWQVFGINAATLCIYGIAEHEEIMWKAFMHSGRKNVWCLYPNKNAPTKSVEDSFRGYMSSSLLSETQTTDGGETMNFILIDGTWSNSAAMFRRLKERADLVWGDYLPCISLTTGASAMHKLRPQPSWDRTCTAAAAIGLLDELHLVSEFKSLGLDKQAEAVENSVDVLLESLTGRRLRMGRSITRRLRHHDDIC